MSAEQEPSAITRQLRDKAVGVHPEEHELRPTAELPNVACGIMELGFPEAIATLVAFADGNTSLYFSNGGGIVGAGQHPTVRRAAAIFLIAAERIVDTLAPATERPYPITGHARFYIRTYDELLTAEVDGEILAAGTHPLSDFFFCGHALITAVREAADPGRASAGDATAG